MAKNLGPNIQNLSPHAALKARIASKVAGKQVDIPSLLEAIEEYLEEADLSPKMRARLVHYVKNRSHTLRVTSTKTNSEQDSGEITISGSYEDIRNIELMMLGFAWARRGEGGIEKSMAYHETPSPIDDPKLKDHWPTDPIVTPNTQYRLFVDEEEHEKQARANSTHDFRAIFVSSITAYASGDIYQARATLLEDAGFICMRSRRGDDGKYWEFWYLPGLYSAKGPIDGKTTDEIVQWLIRNVGPGSISIEGTHWGASID